MGAWNFMVDMGQYARLSEHDEEIDKLKEDMKTAKLWVDYLQAEIVELKRELKEIKNG
jgi:peptidoglycan hydrolase CwlO-like protein